LSSRIPLLVVGGGIGGLATAIAASRAGYRVHVLERAREFGEIGAGLQLAPNALRMMDRLGILEDVRRHAMFPEKLVMMDAVSGEQAYEVDLGPHFVARYDYNYIVMHRADLLQVELDACRQSDLITTETDREAVRVEDLGDGARVICAEGSTYECDALVGADGIRSVTRKVVHDDGDPVCAESVAYRGTIPVSEAPSTVNLRNMTIWVGPDLHFVTYVVHFGELLNLVCVFKSSRYTPGSDEWGTLDELDARFAPMCPEVRAVVAHIGRNRRWAMYDRLPIPNWTRNRITLLGDAAHPMLQYAAQGACQALEDAVCLGDSLRSHRADAGAAFLDYQGKRLERTARVQRSARFLSEFFHVGGIARQLRRALMRSRPPNDPEWFDWLYGYRGPEERESSPSPLVP
jgi:salicylate hydroxylase